MVKVYAPLQVKSILLQYDKYSFVPNTLDFQKSVEENNSCEVPEFCALLETHGRRCSPHVL